MQALRKTLLPTLYNQLTNKIIVMKHFNDQNMVYAVN